MPIVKVPIIGDMNYFQNGKGDGVIVIALALVSLGLVLARQCRALWVTILPTAVLLTLTVLNFQSALKKLKADTQRDLADNPFRGIADVAIESVQLQWGWAVMVVGVVLLISSAAVDSAAALIPKKTKGRRANSDAKIVWGSVAIGVSIAGILAFVSFERAPKSNALSGNLTGTLITKGKLQPAIVHRDWLEGIDEETVSAVLKQMEKRKVTLRSDMVVLQIQGAAEGIKITATPGLHADLIAVDVSSHKTLSSWQQKQGAKLSDRHQKEVIRAAKSFVQEWRKAEAVGEKTFDFSRFHDSLGIGALTSGLGGEAVAIVNRVPHSCVAEQQGLLYFMLPPGTERFELQGREDAKGIAAFSGHFIVEVEAEAPTKKSKKTDDEPEMSEDDDPEMKSKSFGKPALNDPSAMDESMPEKPKTKKKGTKSDD